MVLKSLENNQMTTTYSFQEDPFANHYENYDNDQPIVEDYYDKSDLKVDLTDNGKERIFKINELDMNIIHPTGVDDKIGGSKIFAIGKPGCFIKGTKTILYDGTIRNIEDITTDDVLMGDDSTPRQVLELCRGREEMYKVTPVKGESYTVNKNHILSLKCTGYNNIKKGTIVDISIEEYLKKSDTWKIRFKGYRTGIDFSEKEIEVDPYLFGYWLGDGTSASAQITTIDPEIIDEYNKKLELSNLELHRQKDTIAYNIAQKDKKRVNGGNVFINFFKKYGIYNNKHIPLHYKVNSREIRLSVLAGLLDADGHYDHNGCFDLTLKSEKLFDDTIYLCRSLGFSCYKQPCKKGCMYKGEYKEGDYFRCYISGDLDQIPCILTRKIPTKRRQVKDVLVSGITVEPVGIDNYYGFTLDGNHRFILDDFTVTHNSGKSTILNSLVYSKRHLLPVGRVFCGTQTSTGGFSGMFPEPFIYDGLSVNDLGPIESYIKRQILARRYLVPPYSNPWSLEYIDDCLDDVKCFAKPPFQKIYKNGRHYKTLHIMSVQFCLDLKPNVRNSIDGSFIMQETVPETRKKLWNNYAGALATEYDYWDFNDIMDEITGDHTAIYFHNLTESNKIEDKVFYYKADRSKLKDFRFGCPDYWAFADERYDKNYVDHIL